MMRKFLVRPTLVDKQTMHRKKLEHENKVRQARHAIDCLSPPTYSHMTVKPKKLQLEHERIWKIENENRRLLSRLADIMNGDGSRSSIRPAKADYKRLRGGPYRSCVIKIRAGQPKSTQTEEQMTNGIKEHANCDWKNLTVPRRPHTVAVMVRKRGSRPASTNSINMQSVIGCNEANRSKKGHKQALCGCTSRQQQEKSLSSAAVNKEAVEAQKVEQPEGVAAASIRSPLNDVTDLLCGIQSVEITVKQPSSE